LSALLRASGALDGSLTDQLGTASTFLFVPGDRPERFSKAAGAGADFIIIDLEDAVAPEKKSSARQNAEEWLSSGSQAIIRINAAGTVWHAEDLKMASAFGAPVMVPKAEDSSYLAHLGREVTLLPLIETASGVLNAAPICSLPSVVRVAFGHIDLAAQIGVHPGDAQAFLSARSSLVLASAAAGIAPPIDGVTTTLTDAAVLASDIDHAKSLGMTGKLLIHPAQVDPARRGFLPAEEDVQWAHSIWLATQRTTTVAVDGQMVDQPVITRARRILERAGVNPVQTHPADVQTTPGDVRSDNREESLP
jgi:citrate lyase subunit beta / citryl-CoA lyase